MTSSRRRNRAGESALHEWRALRRSTFRRDWRAWTLSLVFTIGFAVAIPFSSGALRLLWAGLLGANATLLLFGWLIGGDAHSLPWLWGRVGEQQTEDVLRRLDPSWAVEHDLRHERGNWDHIVVGPAGLFLLETKAYRARAVVADDKLRLGRTVIAGGAFRGAARQLYVALGRYVERCPWVQAVVVIWGDFPQMQHAEKDVVYTSGETLADWLGERPRSLDPSEIERLGIALGQLRDHGLPASATTSNTRQGDPA